MPSVMYNETLQREITDGPFGRREVGMGSIVDTHLKLMCWWTSGVTELEAVNVHCAGGGI